MQITQRVQKVARACVACFVMLTVAVAAGGAPTPAGPGATIKQNLESRFPGTHVLDVQPTQIPDLYEVFTGDQIVYTDAAGDRLILGPMVDTKSHENLTQARLNERGKIDFKTLPVAKAIKIVKGNGSRTFAVFSDPDCPYCQQLEKSLLNVTDTTMYVFLFPIAALHPQAPEKAHAIWCAPDRAAAWNKWMHEKALPPAKSCAGDPVDSLQKLGDELHINSTPTIFFADGSRVAGALPDKELEKALSAASAGRQKGPTS